MTHRQICQKLCSWLLGLQGVDLACYELKWFKGFADVIGTSTKDRTVNKRIVIVEVKRTRADLLQDLRNQKLLKYETRASHCYLAGTTDAFLASKYNQKEILDDLTLKGLPSAWGVVLVTEGEPKVLRNPRKLQTIQTRTCQALIKKIAKSYMYRILSPTSPMAQGD